MKQELAILHLYPVEMNIYGDRGNVLTLVKRLQWRGIGAKVIEAGVGEKVDLKSIDLIFAGGGQDRGQIAVGRDLQDRKEDLLAAAEDGMPMLTVCGTYQLFGRFFQPKDGERIEGISLFKAETVAGSTRMIGNISVKTSWGLLTGFENHSGQTELDEGQQALGSVLRGYGNTPRAGTEGAVHKNVFGTYMHGPLLPKNPAFADHLLAVAMQRKYGVSELTALDDSLELAAHNSALSRPR
jgi:lipid II isoglutaminyl synthase (glutamine-hydrolysing)